MDEAIVGLWGVVVGALISLVGTVVVPWIRDTKDRERVEREALKRERGDAIIAAMTALMDMHHRNVNDPGRAQAQVRFADRFNYLTLRLTEAEQPVLDMLNLMLVMVQDAPRRQGIENMAAQIMNVLTRWVRGDIATAEVVSEIERRARLEISPDRMTARPLPPEDQQSE